MNNKVKELDRPTRAVKTHEAQIGDIISVDGGRFKFRVVGSKKLDHSLNRKPGFKEVKEDEKIKIWVCPNCKNMETDENFVKLAKGHEALVCECSMLLASYEAQEV